MVKFSPDRHDLWVESNYHEPVSMAFTTNIIDKISQRHISSILNYTSYFFVTKYSVKWTKVRQCTNKAVSSNLGFDTKSKLVLRYTRISQGQTFSLKRLESCIEIPTPGFRLHRKRKCPCNHFDCSISLFFSGKKSCRKILFHVFYKLD